MREDEALDTLGIARGEERANVRTRRDAHERRPTHADVIENRSDVVHPRLERDVARTVGEPGPSRIEQNDTHVCRETLEEGAGMAAQPDRQEVRDLRGEHERLWPLADDLIGDRDPTGACVVNVWDVHCVSVPCQPPGRKPAVKDPKESVRACRHEHAQDDVVMAAASGMQTVAAADGRR